MGGFRDWFDFSGFGWSFDWDCIFGCVEFDIVLGTRFGWLAVCSDFTLVGLEILFGWVGMEFGFVGLGLQLSWVWRFDFVGDLARLEI